jgi:signal transduction histidine kinase/ActR/RegA family two-component response regulator
MLLTQRSAGWAYLIAVLGAGAVMATRAVVFGVMGTLIATFVFLLVVLAAGVAGGWKPGFLTTGLNVVGVLYFFTPPFYTFRVSKGTDVVRLLAYVGAGVAISLLCEGLRRAWARVEERQRQLEQEISERIRAEEQLREADRRKDEFLATLAHELRNPLAPLSNALQLWSYVASNAAELENLRAMMKRQVDQMTRLIDDLLDVARIRRGKIQLRTAPVDLAAVVSEAIDSHKSLAELGGHRLTVSLPVEKLAAEGDATRLLQIFGNVLHNAIKFTPPGGQIAVTLERAGSQAVIRIRDSGCGVPPAMLSQIFEMFQQVDQSLGRAHGGLGIGLTLVKRLVELHGGTITASSEGPGKGSEFVITLPALSTEQDGSASPESERANPARCDLRRRRILVVDDARASAETLTLLLRAIGHEVAMAHDGRSALDWTREHKPEVVFLDIAMPGMDGYEVARRIRGTAGLEEIILVALTGYGQEDDRRRAGEAGFNHHLTKPTSLAALHDVLSPSRQPLASPNRGLQTTGERRSDR